MQAINSENRIIYAKFYVKGDLKEYISITEDFIVLSPNDVKNFYVNIELPKDIDQPGRNDNRIGIVETSNPNEKGAMIGAVAGVESQLWIEVPYKEKYIDAQLSATNVKSGEDIDFILKILNKGISPIENIKARLTIYNFNDELMKTLDTETRSLDKQASTAFELIMPSLGLNIGNYRSKAIIDYDGMQKTVETNFKIGDFLIKINSLEIAAIEQGSIGEILINLENFWPEIINNIKLELKIFKKGNLIDSLQSSSHSINPWEVKTIPLYWKSGNNAVGEYEAELILTYGDKIMTSNTKFNIIAKGENPEPELPFNFSIPITLLIMLSASGLIIYYLFKSGKIKIK